MSLKSVRLRWASRKAEEALRRKEKARHLRKSSACVKLAKKASHPWVEKLEVRVRSKGCGNGVGRVGEVGTVGSPAETGVGALPGEVGVGELDWPEALEDVVALDWPETAEEVVVVGYGLLEAVVTGYGLEVGIHASEAAESGSRLVSVNSGSS